ncbi:MAG: thiol reductant ABC exporter subunit CydC [Arachnia propionica]|uniref:thiol reductant ABC exporter subunit CydC n=1 Tax=Arachnia propionica TaxID=1750 RepID=UPI0026F5C175|nr:thiol reductant ABC exporter subunit CydC [Arachnia propionica]
MKGLVTALLAEVPRGRLRLAAAVLLAFLASFSSVALMGLSAWLISFAALMPPVLYLQAPAVGVRTFAISRGVFRYLERLVGHDVALRMQSALRVRTYDALARTTLIGARRGDLLSRVMADTEAVTDVLVRVLIPFSSALLVVTVTSAGVAVISPGAGAVLLVTALLAGVVVPWWAQRASLAVDAAAVPTRGRLSDAVREVARTAPDLVAHGAEAPALERLLGLDAELREQESRGAWVRGVAGAVQVVAAGVAVVAGLAIGAPAVVSGAMHPTFLAVLALTPLALHEVLATFASAAQTWTRARSALGRVAEMLEADPVGTGDVVPDGEAAPGLRLSGVSVGWPGGPVVQEGLDLGVAPGERVALTGASGVGKTTVAATAMGLIPPRSGVVERGGRVGYLAQDAHIFATSVAENVRIGDKDASNEEISRALARAGLPLEPERLVGEDGASLSGGERRRLALARLLVADRDLWILDEPTEHLDQATAEALMADVWEASTGRAVLVITHDPSVVSACDRELRLS